MIVELTAEAKADLEDIGDFIARANPRRALTFVAKLSNACRSLADNPRRYPLVPRYEASGVRRCAHGDYLIFYRILDEHVEILHILHGARDYEAILFPAS